MQVCLQSIRRNYVKFPLLLLAKHGEEVRELCPFPVPKCRIDFAESWHTNFIDYHFNAKDFQQVKRGYLSAFSRRF